MIIGALLLRGIVVTVEEGVVFEDESFAKLASKSSFFFFNKSNLCEISASTGTAIVATVVGAEVAVDAPNPVVAVGAANDDEPNPVVGVDVVPKLPTPVGFDAVDNEPNPEVVGAAPKLVDAPKLGVVVAPKPVEGAAPKPVEGAPNPAGFAGEAAPNPNEGVVVVAPKPVDCVPKPVDVAPKPPREGVAAGAPNPVGAGV